MTEAQPDLLRPTEPAPFDIVNSEGKSNLALVCDHASNRVPAVLDNLGLSSLQLASHIGWDPGAAEVALRVSAGLDAPLLLSNYSRLVIDCNRPPEQAESIPETSGGHTIPGNLGLTPAQRLARRQALFDPYHAAIAALLRQRAERQPALLSIHSFTPSLFGEERPWSIGVCYRTSATLADCWLDALRRRVRDPVGDNQPYEIEAGIDYTIPQQAERLGIPGIMLELRQDRIVDTAGIRRWADVIIECALSIASR